MLLPEQLSISLQPLTKDLYRPGAWGQLPAAQSQRNACIDLGAVIRVQLG